LKELRDKHRDDPLTLATETFALQRAAGAGPLTSLLPGLAQAPFFMVMFAVVNHSLLGGALLGVPLTAHLTAGLPIFAVLLALAVALAWWSARRMPADTPRWLTVLPYHGGLPAARRRSLPGHLDRVDSGGADRLGAGRRSIDVHIDNVL
jgi:YidC/Oxa1 family membrane protein insertase